MPEDTGIIEAIVAPDEVEEKELPGVAATPVVDDREAIRARAEALMAEARRLLASLDGGAEEEEKVVEETPAEGTTFTEPLAAATPTVDQIRDAILERMGLKEEEREGAFICSIQRKAMPAGSEVCDACQGGCQREKGLPGVLDIEATAEAEYKGVVLDSGYSPSDDLFVVNVKRASDDKVIEAYYNGSGESAGWLMLNQSLVSEKSEVTGMAIISAAQAEEIAMKQEMFAGGEAYGVDADIFEGQDAYVVEIDMDSTKKSYDAYISLDGEYLGHDEYDLGDEDDIKTDEAEAYFKREFNQEQRDRAATEGAALPDGSYPIRNRTDLSNAIQAFGRAKDKAAAKAHIMKRARALGALDMVPDSWKGGAEKVMVGDEEDPTFLAQLMEFQMLQAQKETS
jgi:hypothetical protein